MRRFRCARATETQCSNAVLIDPISLRRVAGIDYSQALQWRDGCQAYVGSDQYELIWFICRRRQSAGKLNRVEAAQRMWLYLSITIAQGSRQREHSRSKRDQPIHGRKACGTA